MKTIQDKFVNQTYTDTPPSSLMDSTTSPKVKTTEGKGVEAHNTLRVKGRVGTPKWD